MNFKSSIFLLKDLLELIIDHRGKTPKKMGFDDFHSSGIPVLSAKHVKTEGLTNIDSIRFSNDEMYKKWMKIEVQDDDIVLTSEAPMGELFYIDGQSKYLLGQRVFGLRAKKELVDPKFLFSWLASRDGQSQIANRASGSTVQGIKQSELLKIEVNLPSIEIQRKIGKQRFDLDKKIELNRQINQTLEEMAQAIFKSWFVDFDPVKAKIAALENGGTEDNANLAAMLVISGKTTEQLDSLRTESPDQYQKLYQTAQLFPSVMQESELGEIPASWVVLKLSNLVKTITKGTTPRKADLTEANDNEGQVAFIKVKDLDGLGNINFSSLESIPSDIHNKQLKRSILETGDILFSIAGTIGRVALIPEELDNSNLNQALGIIRLKNKEFVLPLALMTLRSSRVQNDIQSKIVQGVQANASLQNLKDIQVLMPFEDRLLHEFNHLIGSAIQRVERNKKQNRILTELRAQLLPKLLSGEVLKNHV